MSEVPDKRCPQCGDMFNIRVSKSGRESLTAFNARLYCGIPCANAASKERKHRSTQAAKAEARTRAALKIKRDSYGDIELLSYFDTKEFKGYQLRVHNIVVKSGKRGATTADIHRKLGYDKQHWTMDCLHGYEQIGASPTRFAVMR